MKNFFVLCFLLISSRVFAQKIDGFYTGVLHNDSANRMVQQYELAIAMYKGKITGYSYVTFIVKDTFYYGIRKVKGEIVGDSIVVEDDKFVSNNFPESPAKGVKRTITIPLNGQDSIVSMSGSWKTNRTKKYYSVPGTIELAKSKDSINSPLINHLKELGIIQNNYVAENIADVKEKEKETGAAVAKLDEKKKGKEKGKEVAATGPKENEKNTTATTMTGSKSKTESKKEAEPAFASQTKTQNESKTPAENTVASNTKTKSETPATTSSNKPGTESEVKAQTTNVSAPGTNSKSETAARPDKKNKIQSTDNTEPVASAETTKIESKARPETVTRIETNSKNEIKTAGVKTIENAAAVKISYEKRKMNATQTIETVADSLVLSFYDNGVVDGDSISVYLNGENIISNAKLKTVATKKTISVSGMQEMHLVLVAENLGSLPPNTGLLTIWDGDKYYQVHFSADMQTNASIIIRKKKN